MRDKRRSTASARKRSSSCRRGSGWWGLRPHLPVWCRSLARGAVLCALCGLLAGCFEPMYAQKTLTGGPSLQNRFATIGIIPVSASTGTSAARVAVEVQNDLSYDFTGGGGQLGKTHELRITLVQQV